MWFLPRRGTILALVAGLLLANPALASPAVDEILQYHVAFRSFSELHSALASGHYDHFEAADLARALFRSEARLTDQERDALLTVVLNRTESDDDYSDVISVILQEFAELRDHALRARVLRQGSAAGLEDTLGALHHSLRTLATMLRHSGEEGLSAGYEMEAIAAAYLAPDYPSVAAAELLRTIAVFSPDRHIVSAARSASRSILREMDTDSGESI